MAQHYKIESWINEKWYPKVMKRIKWILKYTSGNLALSYKTKINDILDKDNSYQLSNCNIEIHSKSRGMRQNKLIQAYIVL